MSNYDDMYIIDKAEKFSLLHLYDKMTIVINIKKLSALFTFNFKQLSK